MSACEDRGEDLVAMLLATREAERAPLGTVVVLPNHRDLMQHLFECPACSREFEELKRLAEVLPAAHAGLAPRPGTRAALLRAVSLPSLEDLPPAPPPPVRFRHVRGRRLLPLLPLGLTTAATLMMVVLFRPDRLPASPGGIETTHLWGGAVLGFSGPGRSEGWEFSARKTSSFRLGAPVEAELVLGEESRIRVPEGGGARRVLELASGRAWIDPSPAAGDPAAALGPLRVRAGEVEIEERGAQFSVERRDDGSVSVWIEAGVAVVRSGIGESVASGPCRVDAAPGQSPSPSRPADGQDATAWFAYPELHVEVRPGAAEGTRDLVLELRPSVPRRIRIAPFDPFDPLFTLRAAAEGSGLRSIPLQAGMLRRPAPGPDPDGGFLLGPRTPYTIVLDVESLGLPAGRYRLEAHYAASRPGGLWKGSRSSNAVEVEVRAGR